MFTGQSVKIVHPDGSEAERSMLDAALQAQGIRQDQVRVHYGSPADADTWVERVGDAEIVLAGWSIPDAALAAFPNVRAIVYLGTGAADHVNLPLAAKRGIEVKTVGGYGDDSVAEHALALLFASARSIPEHDATVRAGRWDQQPGTLLSGKTIGIVGLGGIGRRMAAISSGIGMNVLGWKRVAEQGVDKDDAGIPLAPLAELFERCDVISLHLSLTPETEGLISAGLISKLRPGAILVNTARAGVMDTRAALERAEAGLLRFAADVFDPEPLPVDDAERTAVNTVLTPHIAFNTPEAAQALYKGAARHLQALTNGTEQ